MPSSGNRQKVATRRSRKSSENNPDPCGVVKSPAPPQDMMEVDEEEERRDPANDKKGKKDMSKMVHEPTCSYYLWDVKHRQSLLKDEQVKDYALQSLKRFVSRNKGRSVPGNVPAPENVEAHVERSMLNGHVRKYLDQERAIYESFREIAVSKCNCVALELSESEDNSDDESGLEKEQASSAPDTPVASTSAAVRVPSRNDEGQDLDSEKMEQSPLTSKVNNNDGAIATDTSPLASPSKDENSEQPFKPLVSTLIDETTVSGLTLTSSEGNAAQHLTLESNNGNSTSDAAPMAKDGNTASDSDATTESNDEKTVSELDTASAESNDADGKTDADGAYESKGPNTAQSASKDGTIGSDGGTPSNVGNGESLLFSKPSDVNTDLQPYLPAMSNDDAIITSDVASSSNDGNIASAVTVSTFIDGNPVSPLASISGEGKTASPLVPSATSGGTTSSPVSSISEDGKTASPLASISDDDRPSSSLSAHEKIEIFKSTGLCLSDEDELDYSEGDIDEN